MTQDNAEALFRHASSRLDEGDYPGAADQFSDVIRLCPEMEGAWGNRGFALLEMGCDAEALNDFDMVVRLNAEDAFGHAFRALALRNLGRHAEALESAVEAIELADAEEDVPPARLVRGWLFARAGQLAAACEDLGIYLQFTDDESIEPLYELCRDVLEEGRTECIDSPTGLLCCKECQCAQCGYSFNIAPNPHWREEGGRCPYSHCIAIMPRRFGDGPGVCPVFGHDCPGGERTVAACPVELPAPGVDDFGEDPLDLWPGAPDWDDDWEE
jgi:tetratricopeptide (TPR) repeat protein